MEAILNAFAGLLGKISLFAHAHAEGLKATGDAVSITTVVGAIVGFIPSMAALLTIVWTIIRIWETETVRKLWRRFHGR